MSTIANHISPTFVSTARGRAVTALGAFVLIVMGMNAQLVAHLSTHVIGRSFEDVFEVLWQLSWVRDAIFRLGVSPLFSPFVYYPHGWYLASGAQPVWWMIVLAPLTGVLGPISTYNIAMLATFVIGAWGVYLLVQHFTDSFLGGLVAGCIYVFAPVLTLRQGGHLHILLSMQWLPYLALFSHKSLGNSARRYWIIAGVFLALAVLGHWQFLFMAPLVPLCIIGFAKAQSSWRQRLGLLLRIGVTALILLAPFALHAWYAREQMFSAQSSFSIATQDAASLSPDRLFVPSAGHPLWGAWSRQQFPLRGEADMVSISYAALLLAALGLVKGLSARRAYFGLTLFALVMALGITLHWNAQHVVIALPTPVAGVIRNAEEWLLGPEILPAGNQVLIPMPLAFFARVIPLLNEARVWARYAIVGMLGVAVLAGLGAEFLLHRWSSFGKWIVSGSLAVVLMEDLIMPYAAFTEVAANTRPIDTWLSTRSTPVTLIEYPLPSSNKLAMYRQSRNGQTVVNGYMSVPPTYYSQAATTLGTWPNAATLDLLRQWKVDYVLVNGTNDPRFVEETLPGIRSIKGLCPERDDNEPDLNRHTYLFRIMPEGQACGVGH